MWRDLNMRALPPVICELVYISGKMVHFVALRALSLSRAHAVLNCFLCDHSNLLV